MPEKQTYTGKLYQWVIAAYPYTIEAESPEQAVDLIVNHGEGEYGIAEPDWDSLGDVEDVTVETDEHFIQFGYVNPSAFNMQRGELVEIDREEL